MARRAKTNAKPRSESTPAQPAPTWKKPWVWLVGVVAAVALLLSNINSILSNARALPSEVRKTGDQFFEWYADYAGWKGKWSDFPEGRVDIAQLELTDEPFRLEIDKTSSGLLAGSIETRGICNKIPFFDRLLVEGKIASSRDAEIAVFDFVGGHKRVFATLRLRRDGDVMTALPAEDPSALFAKETRIALDPDDLEADADRTPICGKKREEFMARALKDAAWNAAALTPP